MPFIPHTENDTREMLAAIGVPAIDDLFEEIPAALQRVDLTALPDAVSEQEIRRLMRARAAQDEVELNFIGAGAYEHHIPAAVWEVATRGEYYTAYTPYQAEASQGTLQLIYEFQTMMASLTGLDVSNASLYDGASALAEAILMAVRSNRKSRSRRVLMPASLHPLYAATAHAITASQDIRLERIAIDGRGRTDMAALARYAGQDVTALVIPQPNVFGALEDVDALADWAADNGAVGIGVVNPTALALLKPPGGWGRMGVPIACGEGQPLGVPLSSGGPYFGFLACREDFVRQLPGRLVGRTVDLEGRPGFTLTLQAREQHIRRSRATSNICTNQGLMVTAATIYMSLMGPAGLRRVALACHAQTRALAAKAAAIPGVELAFPEPYFH
ncbi:MAG TPA: aminomethyl-transferring glycine dehydrogenase subunit GcvPA, partial [Gammaproteobacteria bacterium]|nr:aminomethyl-transferring glycine dehydrogenase subunit GcvPA [Gammaproteobacteria bacterium]